MTCFVKAGPEFRVDSNVNGTRTNPAVAALASGGFVMTWTDFTHSLEDLSGSNVKAQIYGAAGERRRGEFPVNTETIDYQCDAKIAGLFRGGFVVVWQDFSGKRGDACGSSVKAKVFGRDGELVRDEFLVNVETNDNQTDPAVAALPNGGFVVAWQDFSGTRGDDSLGSVKARLFGPEGIPSGDEFLVNTHTKDHQGHPSVAALMGGGFVVVWNDFSGVYSRGSIKAKLFGRAGETVRDEFLVTTRKGNKQNLPAVSAIKDGGFVVAWTNCSGALGSRSATGIKARLFDALAAPLDDEFLVNTETMNGQFAPALAPLVDGGFIVVWTDDSGRGGDASGSGIKAKVFGLRGKTVQDEFLVNTETEGDQIAPAVARLVDGNLLVSWQDASSSQHVAVHVGALPFTAIKAQIFAPARASTGAFSPSGALSRLPLGTGRVRRSGSVLVPNADRGRQSGRPAIP